MRNALAHAPAKQRTAVAAMLKTIFAQESKAEAEAQWDTVADALREKQDKLGTFMDASRDDVLAYMDFRTSIGPRSSLDEVRWNPRDRAHSNPARVQTTKSTARSSGHRRRRRPTTRPSSASTVGAIMLETNDEWTVARRYMSLETLARVNDNPIDAGTSAARIAEIVRAVG